MIKRFQVGTFSVPVCQIWRAEETGCLSIRGGVPTPNMETQTRQITGESGAEMAANALRRVDAEVRTAPQHTDPPGLQDLEPRIGSFRKCNSNACMLSKVPTTIPWAIDIFFPFTMGFNDKVSSSQYLVLMAPAQRTRLVKIHQRLCGGHPQGPTNACELFNQRSDGAGVSDLPKGFRRRLHRSVSVLEFANQRLNRKRSQRDTLLPVSSNDPISGSNLIFARSPA